jgi:hypothetical protein
MSVRDDVWALTPAYRPGLPYATRCSEITRLRCWPIALVSRLVPDCRGPITQELASPLEKEIPVHKCKGVLNSVAKFFTPGSQVEPQKVSQGVPQAVIYFAERFLRGL